MNRTVRIAPVLIYFKKEYFSFFLLLHLRTMDDVKCCYCVFLLFWFLYSTWTRGEVRNLQFFAFRDAFKIRLMATKFTWFFIFSHKKKSLKKILKNIFSNVTKITLKSKLFHFLFNEWNWCFCEIRARDEEKRERWEEENNKKEKKNIKEILKCTNSQYNNDFGFRSVQSHSYLQHVNIVAEYEKEKK